jgi:hypothetical protein
MEMCQWHFEAWQSASQDMTVTGFKVTGTSKNMDRSIFPVALVQQRKFQSRNG